MSDIKIYNGSLYDYTAGVFCGVLITERVMKKLARLQSEHVLQVKRLLHDEYDRGNVFPADWTLHYPEGKQTIVKYIDESKGRGATRDTIRRAVHSHQPKHMPLVFIANGRDEAIRMADEHFAQQNKVEDDIDDNKESES